MAKVDGKISFPERKEGAVPVIGETWKVEVIGTNPGETVNFLRLIEKIEPQEPVAHEARYDRSADKRGSGSGYGGDREKRFGNGQRDRVNRAISERELQMLEHQHRDSREKHEYEIN